MNDSADNIVKKADKLLQKGFFSFFTSDYKYEDASELYTQAANQYKISKEWSKVTECYLKAAEMQVKLSDKNQEANYLIEAANSLKRYSYRDAEAVFKKAVDIFLQQGRFMQSSKIYKSLAELFLDDGDHTTAINYFKKAAEYAEMDEYGTSIYGQCITKYAELIAFYLDRYHEAIQILEKQGVAALKKPLLQYSAKDYFFKAGIIYLASGDSLDSKIAIEKYINMDSRIGNSSEMEFLLKLSNSLEQNKLEDFMKAIEGFDRIHHLDDWKIHFLHKAKESLIETPPPVYNNVPDLT